MAGKRLFVPLVLGFAILLALALSDHFASATVVKTTSLIRLCQATEDAATRNTGQDAPCVTQNNAPGSRADLQQWYSMPAPDPNFAKINTITAPAAWTLASDIAANRGTWMGKMASVNTLSLLNGPCNQGFTLSFRFLASTTNTAQAIDWNEPLGGRNLAEDNTGANCAGGPNLLPDYVDCYPSYLNTMFDPDGDPVTLNSLVPRSRLSSHVQITQGAPPTELSFVTFNLGDLMNLPAPDRYFGAALGYVNFVVLNNPAGALMPSSISAFCTNLSTVTTIFGATPGRPNYIPLAGTAAELGTQCNGSNDADGGTVDAVIDDGCFRTPGPAGELPVAGEDFNNTGEGCRDFPLNTKCCNGLDDDADTVRDDGCVVSDYCGPNRAGDGIDNDGDTTTDEGCNLLGAQNPAAGSGVAGSGTHIFGAYTQVQRDADNDGFENSLDACALTTDANFDPRVAGAQAGDTDGDKLANSCDPDAVARAAAASCGGSAGLPDYDQDCFPNLPYADRCPLVPNGWENGAASGLTGQCNNLLDEDNDYVNDGCPQVGGAAESGAQCNNRFDDDQDGAVNDGCPQVGLAFEAGGQCANTTSDDGDGVNDGCPQVGSVSEANILNACDDAISNDPAGDDGGTPVVNDGCPGLMAQVDQDIQRGNAAADGGPLNDGIGDACEPDWNPNNNAGALILGGYECISGAANCTAAPADWMLKADRPDGYYHTDYPRDASQNQAACVGPGVLDTDGDGWCDATEIALGSCASDPCLAFPGSPAANTSTPENIALYVNIPHLSFTGHPLVDPAPQGCSDLTVYGALPPAAPTGIPEDNDKDGKANMGVNDGCPIVGVAEIYANGQCENNTDDDGDTVVNDGCPPIGAAETACTNAVDDDADGDPDCAAPEGDIKVLSWTTEPLKEVGVAPSGMRTITVNEVKHDNGPMPVTAYAMWTATYTAGQLRTRWISSQVDDACTLNGVSVNCATATEINDIEFQVPLPVSSDVLLTRDLEITCLTPGPSTFTLTLMNDELPVPPNLDPTPGNNTLSTVVTVYCGDTDGDIVAGVGFDTDEAYLGTDPNDGCPDTTSDPAWPLDQDNNAQILIPDVSKYTGKLFIPVTCPSADPNCRLDLDHNGQILIPDVSKYTGKLFVACVQ